MTTTTTTTSQFQSALKELAISEQDVDFVTTNFNGNPNIPSLLFKLYIAAHILDLSTETRYISFVTFYQYLHQYRLQYFNVMIQNSKGGGQQQVQQQQQQQQQQSSANNNSSTSMCTNDDEYVLRAQHHLAKIAAATLFLACKISNENRRIRDVINIHHMLQFSNGSTTTTATTTSSSSSSTTTTTTITAAATAPATIATATTAKQQQQQQPQ